MTHAFSLTKWYMDCVTADGQVVVAYWSQLEWSRFSATWTSFTHHGVHGVNTVSKVGACAPPREHADRIDFVAPALDCELHAVRSIAPFDCNLLDSHSGQVRWECRAPAATMRGSLGNVDVSGTGYVECLALTIYPWHLPIRELRWGRFVSTDTSQSVVWIDWRGPAPSQWVFVNGRASVTARMHDDGIVADGHHLILGTSRELHVRRFGEVWARVPGLAAVVPDRLLQWSDQRWYCEATLLVNGESYHGTAVHELVTMP
jgi:hypothetical protein